jgi:hypothetical protein
VSVLGAVKAEEVLVEVLADYAPELDDLEASAPVPKATATTATISITTIATTATDLETASLEVRPLENRLIRCRLTAKRYLNIKMQGIDIVLVGPTIFFVVFEALR